jgi:predicted dehydrogenase
VHGRWTRAALAAGKHVLCEKPFTANAAEARGIAELAAASDRVVMAAMEYRYHPLTLRAEEIIASGQADAVMLGRAMLREPRWALRAAHELGADIEWAPQLVRGRH